MKSFIVLNFHFNIIGLTIFLIPRVKYKKVYVVPS